MASAFPCERPPSTCGRRPAGKRQPGELASLASCKFLPGERARLGLVAGRLVKTADASRRSGDAPLEELFLLWPARRTSSTVIATVTIATTATSMLESTSELGETGCALGKLEVMPKRKRRNRAFSVSMKPYSRNRFNVLNAQA
eukprot:5055045-Prymnesium_polylepis.2